MTKKVLFLRAAETCHRLPRELVKIMPEIMESNKVNWTIWNEIMNKGFRNGTGEKVAKQLWSQQRKVFHFI